MRKHIGVKGEITMNEELDLIATLEQENRQLHARNQRLESELEIANNNGIEELRNKLDMHDQDKFESFRMATRALAKCYEKGNMGVLVADIGDKVSIMGINADMNDVLMMASGVVAKLEEVIADMDDEDRVIN